MTKQFYKSLTLLLIALLGECGNVWGNTWTGNVAVGSGKGSATVKVYKYPLGVKVESGSATSSDGTLQTATTSGWGTTEGSIEFTANAENGYTFYAWYSDSDCKNDENKSATYTNGKNKGETTTRYAKFAPNTYTVNFFRISGSTDDKVGTATVTYDATYGKGSGWINSTTRTGYTFAGWYTNDGSTRISGTDKVSILSNIALYAHWTANAYDVTLNANGGVGNDQVVSATYDDAMPTKLKNNKAIVAPTKTGYTFAGYFDAASGGTKYYNADLSSARTWNYASTKTLYAQWTANTYTIAYDANGGTGTTGSSSHTYNKAKALTTNGFSKTGYSFAGWATSPTGSVVYTNGQSVSNLSATQGATVTLYAVWSANQYTITFNKQNGTGGTDEAKVHFDNNDFTVATIVAPTREDCTFEGYYTAENGGGVQIVNKNGAWQAAAGFIENGVWKNGGNVTLYAYWKHNQTITWNLADGEGVEYTTGQVLGATASSNLTVTYTSGDESVATIIGDKLNVVKPNVEVTITAHQAGNHDWNVAEDVSKTFKTKGATPNDWTEVTASGITYGQVLSESTLSGAVKVNGITIAGSFAWLEPTTQPNAGANQPFAVRFTPTNTEAYGAVDFNVNVNVAKATPRFTWNISNILRENVRYSNFVVSSNKEVPFSTASGSALISVSGPVLRTGEVDAVVQNLTITVSQAASANYNAGSETKTVAIYPKAGVCLPFNPMTESDFYNSKVAVHDNVTWCNTTEQGFHDDYIANIDVLYSQSVGIALGSYTEGLDGMWDAIVNWIKGKSTTFDYTSKSVDLAFSGIPQAISFEVESQQVTSRGYAFGQNLDVTWPATGKAWHLYTSVDGVTYTEIASFTSDDASVSKSLDENVRFIRIEYNGNFTGFVKNLRITQKKSLTTDKSSLTFGTEANPLQEPQTIKVSYSSLGVCGGLDDAITVTSSNPAFYVDETTITENVGLELKGEYTVRVRCNDVNQSGTITFTSNDGTTKSVTVTSTKPSITSSATNIFQTGTEHAPVEATAYRALKTHDFAACFSAGTPIFDTLYIFGVTESGATDRLWSYDAKKGYNVPAVNVTTGKVHTPCFVYAKNGNKYDYVRTFAAETDAFSLNVAGEKLGFEGYKPAGTEITLNGNADVYLDNTELNSSASVLSINGNVTLHARGTNILAANAAAIQLAATPAQLTIEDSWISDAASAVLALRPAAGYPSIDLGSAEGRVVVNGTLLELHNAIHLAIVHMDGTAEKYDGEVRINDGSIGGEAVLGMPKHTYIDGGTFNDGTVEAYTVRGVGKRPRNSRGEMLSRHSMSKAVLAAEYDWYGQSHLTLDAVAKVNPMLMDELVCVFEGYKNEDGEDAANWTKWPTENDDVLIDAPMRIAGAEMKVRSLTINWVSGEKGKPAVIVDPDGGLTVGEGGIDGSVKDNLMLKAGQEGDTKGETGFLRIHPNSAEPMPEATVEMFSIGYYDKSSEEENIAAWQYVGAPVHMTDLAKTVFTRSWIYSYVESEDSWVNNRSKLVMQPFVGYATTQYDSKDGKLMEYSGDLLENDKVYTHDLVFTDAEHGHNVMANSFVAPIDVTKLQPSDFVNAEPVIYLFNTGSRAQALENAGVKGNAPGQFISIAIGTAKEMEEQFKEAGIPTTIAPMQGFSVNATGAEAKVTLDYNKLVWSADYSKHPNAPMHVAERRKEVNDNAEQENEAVAISGALMLTIQANGWSDNCYLLESEAYENAFEMGYDAHKMESGNLNIFTLSEAHQLAINATNSIVGTHVGVRTGEETAYTLYFSYLNTETDLVFFDIEADEKIDIFEGMEYTFFAEPNTVITERFQIVARENAPGVTTGSENTENGSKVHKFIQNGQLYILKNGVLYNATGAVVR